MSLATTVTHHWPDLRRLHVTGTLTASSNYSTNGDTVDFSDYKIKSTMPPILVRITGVNGYVYSYVPGTTKNNGKMKVATTAATELGAGAYPAGVTGDTITFEAIFRKLL